LPLSVHGSLSSCYYGSHPFHILLKEKDDKKAFCLFIQCLKALKTAPKGRGAGNGTGDDIL